MKQKIINLTIDKDVEGIRLDRCLSRLVPECSRSFLQKTIKDGKAKINGVVCNNQRLKVEAGMELTLELEEAESTEPVAEDFDLPIIYEDEYMVVINKPDNMVVHPAIGNPNGTVVNALLGRYPHLQETMSTSAGRPGIVHRLDKDTTGILLVGKTPQAQFKLSKAFADRRVSKTYMALVLGVPKEESGKIITLIGRHQVNRKKMAVVTRNGKEAITLYDVVKSGTIECIPASMLCINILTGRTHQIRVHLSSIGHPVVGDKVYGGNRLIFAPRQMLHAWKLKIPHPVTGELVEFTAPLPDDFDDLVRNMR
ncbi:MAG: RluA family pseudouridine synthase [Lentisphaerae bacterium]|nr:RluA family pseudouridine synthase [Lentisphaerota bacterium]MCP4102743.1 RluA family pseudouridine synthase [Lentisphaerota bacterium]